MKKLNLALAALMISSAAYTQTPQQNAAEIESLQKRVRRLEQFTVNTTDLPNFRKHLNNMGITEMRIESLLTPKTIDSSLPILKTCLDKVNDYLEGKIGESVYKIRLAKTNRSYFKYDKDDKEITLLFSSYDKDPEDIPSAASCFNQVVGNL